MPYTVSCSPAPVTFTIKMRIGWQWLGSVAYVCGFAFWLWRGYWRDFAWERSYQELLLLIFAVIAVLGFIRRERVEVYPDRIVWRKTYFGISRSKAVPISDVNAVEWCEGDDTGHGNKTPDYVAFYLPSETVKACYGFTFEDFERMREDIRGLFPDLVKRWGNASVRSKEFTLLNLS